MRYNFTVVQSITHKSLFGTHPNICYSRDPSTPGEARGVSSSCEGAESIGHRRFFPNFRW